MGEVPTEAPDKATHIKPTKEQLDPMVRKNQSVRRRSEASHSRSKVAQKQHAKLLILIFS
jgi:hypothetical protein